MQYKKEFWAAVFLFVCTLLIYSDFFRHGFASYRITGMILFPLLTIAFARRALKK